ncbi:kappa-type opioid receptor-like [Saccostrea echinata]|uniref:kappa-type opioid receptor-like n=1 Tax=Saccostrea echinata TaxID=191078 RepID=UPI002A837125|nr:kappa-type opioid receptor-like [Saccostrea echinata]
MNTSSSMTVSHDSVYGYAEKASLTIRIRLVVIPVIFIVGFLGNTLTASLFLGKSLRAKSCSIYLAVKAISDNGFLVSLLVAWLDFVDVRIFHTQVVCHMTLYLSYVCGFVSVWSVVLVTIENYVRICRPSEVRSLCSRYVAKRITILGVVFGCMLYNYPLWTMDISPPQPHQQRFCHTLHKFERFEVVMTYVDTVLTLVIPLIIIIILICIIAVSLVDASKRRDRLRKSSSYSSVNSTQPKNRSAPTLPHSKVTKMLLSVSLVFVCLHTPSHAIRMKATLENLLGQTTVTSQMDRVLQHFFLVLYYLNFSIYFFIYIICGQNFRKVLKKKINQWYGRKEHVTRTSDCVLNNRTEDIELETSKNTLDMD